MDVSLLTAYRGFFHVGLVFSFYRYWLGNRQQRKEHKRKLMECGGCCEYGYQIYVS